MSDKNELKKLKRKLRDREGRLALVAYLLRDAVAGLAGADSRLVKLVRDDRALVHGEIRLIELRRPLMLRCKDWKLVL